MRHLAIHRQPCQLASFIAPTASAVFAESLFTWCRPTAPNQEDMDSFLGEGPVKEVFEVGRDKHVPQHHSYDDTRMPHKSSAMTGRPQFF
jgi:hypothetical protein